MSTRGPFQDKPSIRVEALALSRGGRVLFENLSFAAASGAYVEVQGSNGSGKTSLLRAMAGLLRPRAGSVLLILTELMVAGGVGTASRDRAVWRAHLGVSVSGRGDS